MKTVRKQRPIRPSPTFVQIIREYRKTLPPEPVGERLPLGEGWTVHPSKAAHGYNPTWRIHAGNGLGAVFECHGKRLAFFLAAVMNAYEQATGDDAYERFCR